MSKTKKRPMKQGRRKRGTSAGVAEPQADRRGAPKSAKRFPDKDENVRPAPGTAVKGPGTSRSPGARDRHKTASPKRNAK
jgi:hypothetical protein